MLEEQSRQELLLPLRHRTPVPQGPSAQQLSEQATNLLEGSTKIHCPCSLLMTCKWTLVSSPTFSIPNCSTNMMREQAQLRPTGTAQTRLSAPHSWKIYPSLLTEGDTVTHHCCLYLGPSAPTPAPATSNLTNRSKRHLCRSSSGT